MGIEDVEQAAGTGIGRRPSRASRAGAYRGYRAAERVREDERRRRFLITVSVVAVASLLGLGTVWAFTQPTPTSVAVAVPQRSEEAPPAGDETTAPTTTSSTTTTTDPEPVPTGEVTIAFAGDIHTEGALADRLAVDPAGFVGPYADVFADADLVVGNLETAVADHTVTATAKQFQFRSPPAILPALSAGGFDYVSLANNHGLDYGRDGLDQSLEASAAHDDMVVGIGANEDEAYAPRIVEIDGIHIGVLAASQVIDSSLISAWTASADGPGMASAKREEFLAQRVRALAAEVDLAVVFLHWGIEAHECPSGVQQQLAETLADAGADVIVGGHAHRVQAGGWLGDAVVHYGLGNFLFYARSAASSRTGAFVVTADVTGPTSFEWVPGRIDNSVPRPLSGDAADAELATWEGQRSCSNLSGEPGG